MLKNIVEKNCYFDSIVLMTLSSSARGVDGVNQVSAMMGTLANQDLLAQSGLLDNDGRKAGPNDLIIAVEAKDSETIEKAIVVLKNALSSQAKQVDSLSTYEPRSLRGALDAAPDANLAFFSVPGPYVRHDAIKALNAGLNLMIFSDNVSIETELELKLYARKRGLLVMGPDCGTSIIGGAALGFANKVNSGDIGIVGASGTGTQEVSVLVHNLGAGVSHAIGTGGRDVSETIGAISMLSGIDLLEQDPATKVIVIVGKPPAPSVELKVLERARQLKKPCIVNFIGGDVEKAKIMGLLAASTLEEAAFLAVETSSGKKLSRPQIILSREDLLKMAKEASLQLPDKKLGLRGLFSGGTLCDEALLVAGDSLASVSSNLKHKKAKRMEDPNESHGHVCIDLGDDLFTIGRPHPMIDFTLRCDRLVKECSDPSCGVILIDVVLGYGSNPDPASHLVPAIRKSKEITGKHSPIFVAYVMGTEGDPQNFETQSKALADEGVLLAHTNAEAARLASLIITRGACANSISFPFYIKRD